MNTNSELRDLQRSNGARFEDDSIAPSAFEGEEAAIASLAKEEDAVLLCDRSHWSILELSGDDRLRFLHNQSTNDFENLQPGQNCDTVFVTSTARTIELATVFATETALSILISHDLRQRIFEWLDRYIFPADKVALKDVSETKGTFALLGAGSAALLNKLGAPSLENRSDESSENAPDNRYRLQDNVAIAGIETLVASGSGLATPGYTLIFPAEGAASVWRSLCEAGARPIGDRAWERLRVEQGRPAPGRELTEDYNPLEAGLWHTISFEKGCYIGQEAIARLNTYKGVKQQLWGVRLPAPADPGTPIFASDGDAKIGTLTSCLQTPEGFVGLAYVRVKAGGLGLSVRVGDRENALEATLMELPYLTRGYLAENA